MTWFECCGHRATWTSHDAWGPVAVLETRPLVVTMQPRRFFPGTRPDVEQVLRAAPTWSSGCAGRTRLALRRLGKK